MQSCSCSFSCFDCGGDKVGSAFREPRAFNLTNRGHVLAEASRGCPGSDGASPYRGLRPCNRARPRALIMAGEKRWIGVSSFWHTPLRPHAELFFSLPRVKWYAGRHARFEHLAGH
jgi:hypothetical protein